ncbi:MAG: response regulator [Alphaproteobacteria bacterium]|nr:response regulator [Alphaproteobacteria bacterium]
MPQRILVIDDESTVIFTLTQVLSANGFEVVSATDADQAMAILANTACDLVLCDLVMPTIDGVRVIQRLGRDYPAVPVIAMTGGGSAMPPALSLPLAEASGARASLVKPFTQAELLTAIREVLTGSGR